MEEYDSNPVFGLLALVHANEIDLRVENESGWLLCRFEDRMVLNLTLCEK